MISKTFFKQFSPFLSIDFTFNSIIFWRFLLFKSFFLIVFKAKLHDRNFESFFFNFVFFVWSGIVIHGHLTKKHEDFQISCHLLPASKGFSKIDSHLIPLLSGRQNHQNIQNYYFLENSLFF